MDIVAERFRIIDQRDRELVRLTADIVLYVDAPLREHRDLLMHAMESFFKLCPQPTLNWYLTETMRRFAPTTPRSFTLPLRWWRDGAPRKDLRELTLKGGVSHDCVPTCGFSFSSAEREDDIFALSANYVRFTVPADYIASHHELFQDFVLLACNTIPHSSGHAGFVLECNPYYQDDAESAAYPLAMRHAAVDISTRTRGPWAVRNQRIKNVAWLTIVGSRLLESVGGLRKLQSAASAPVAVLSTQHGAVVRAGSQPILGEAGDERLSAYHDAYALVRPLHRGIEELFAPFSLDGVDEVEATLAWLRRFSHDATGVQVPLK